MSALLNQQLRVPCKTAAVPARRASVAQRGAVRVMAASNIVDTAVAAGSFKTLVAAVTHCGLADTLKGGSFTVFAPTDAAFAKLPAGTLETLLKPENKAKLTDILLCVPGFWQPQDRRPRSPPPLTLFPATTWSRARTSASTW